MEIIQELFALTDVLSEKKVPYAICGGLAVAIHGRPRMTVDIDLVVAAEHIDAASKVATSVGFDDVTGWVSLPENDLGIARLYRINKIQDKEFLTLDLLEADSAENSLLADCQVFEIDGRIVHVLSKSALIKMKESTERTKDKLDVEMLNDEVE